MRLGSALGRMSGRDPEVPVCHLFKRLSVGLQKGNAALILTRIPVFVPQDIDGDMDMELISQ